MLKNKTLLFIIDMQNDFCSPAGTLYVKGAEQDAERLTRFIRKNTRNITNIILTQDSHNVVDISHPVFWEDKNGNMPSPFSEVTLKQVLGGIWKPRFQKEKAVDYIRKLEKNGEFTHTIWPEHCIIGSAGAAIYDALLDSVKEWARNGNYYEVIPKGTHPLTEHFGALKANIPIPGSPETQINTDLVNKLTSANSIFLAGEARTHCVAYTIKQMVHIGGLARKLYLLKDCMSDIHGFEKLAEPIYKKAESEGARYISSEYII